MACILLFSFRVNLWLLISMHYPFNSSQHQLQFANLAMLLIIDRNYNLTLIMASKSARAHILLTTTSSETEKGGYL